MGKLVHYNKIFPFTEEEKKTIEKACELKDAFDENVFSYSEIPDKEDIYNKKRTERCHAFRLAYECSLYFLILKYSKYFYFVNQKKKYKI